MKNLMKRSRWRAMLVSLAVLLVSGSILYAAYYGVSRTLAATVTVAEVITLPSDAIGIYSDQAGTANLTSLNFGKVPPLGRGYWRSAVLTVYVKNYSNTVGPEPVTFFINAYDTDYDYGDIWVDTSWNEATERWEYPSVLPGGIIPVKINVSVFSNAPAGSSNFTAVIQGRAATAPDVMGPMAVPEEKPAPVPK